jgi:hypothetical protein
VSSAIPGTPNDTTGSVVVITVCDRDDVLIAKYATSYRWWPSPESRRRGSQRWVVPAVEHWHPAGTLAEIPATPLARESTEAAA